MKRVFIAELEPWEISHIRPKLSRYKATYGNDKLIDVDRNSAEAEVLGVFIHTPVTESLLNEMPNLKFVTTMSTGYDHINLEACRKRGIVVSNVPSYGENTVAEHAIGLMLCLSRKLPQAIASTKKDYFDTSGLRGFDLKGKTLGVIGAGRIGQHVIRISKAMGMDVIVVNKSKDQSLAKEFGFRYVSMKELLKKSDMITLHVPLTPDTKHIINMDSIKLMKKGVYIINTARGELIDTRALIFGLKKGIIAGAGLDVLEGEQELEHRRKHSRPLKEFAKKSLDELQKYNVMITPHNAFDTTEAIMRILDTTVLNIESYFKGKPVNVVS